jgi:hypothetical protein
MIKRIHYVSSFAQNMSDDEIEALASQAAKKNAENDITGVLMAQSGIFFQIIEGPEDNIDDLFKSIMRDPRHENNPRNARLRQETAETIHASTNSD